MAPTNNKTVHQTSFTPYREQPRSTRIVQYTSGFLPYILRFTQAPILVWLDGTRIDISTILVTMYYNVSGLLLMFFWCPCMAINVNVQYNGGFLHDIILWTQCYLHRGTCLNVMKRFCICRWLCMAINVSVQYNGGLLVFGGSAWRL